MFGTLIDIDTDGNVLMHDKGIALLPKLFEVYKNKYMGSNMVKWIVSVDDYKSPFRKLPVDEREKIVTDVIFGQTNKKLLKDQLVLDARNEYRKMQYDPLVDQYITMGDQMYKINLVYKEMVPTKENLSQVNEIAIEMAKSAEAREKVKQLIIKDQESGVKIAGANSEDFSLMEQDLKMKG